ncbi:MAG: hypothetical protein HW405_737 [Candidatus Berkelbacteria bacterium]|nr:hypothetical protein [Candidatus Berkelbacteria bacterium]
MSGGEMLENIFFLGLPILFWILLILGLGLIGMVIWVCRSDVRTSYGKKGSRHCIMTMFVSMIVILVAVICIVFVNKGLL